MLTKGIILSINRQENTCLVRIPLFETAGNLYPNEATAISSIPPGVFNGLNVDDVVIVGFEDNNSGKPVILGKLYLGVAEESKKIGGSGKFTDLEVIESATLPIDTKITFEENTTTIHNDEVSLNSLKSLSDIISAVKENSKGILDLKNAGSTDLTAGNGIKIENSKISINNGTGLDFNEENKLQLTEAVQDTLNKVKDISISEEAHVDLPEARYIKIDDTEYSLAASNKSGNGIAISTDNKISVEIDNNTILLNENNQLYASATSNTAVFNALWFPASGIWLSLQNGKKIKDVYTAATNMPTYIYVKKNPALETAYNYGDMILQIDLVDEDSNTMLIHGRKFIPGTIPQSMPCAGEIHYTAYFTTASTSESSVFQLFSKQVLFT